MSEMVVRSRRPHDVPLLAEILAEQQPTSRYPFRWPMPFPVEQFLVRSYEERAWVAEVDGLLAGHVMAGTVLEPELFLPGLPGQEATDLAVVSVLFTSVASRGHGVGALLLDTAVDWIRAQRRSPVLDVLPAHSRALEFYTGRGWREVGRTRFDWLPTDEPDVRLMVLDTEVRRPPVTGS